nr:methyl-accepting chemotaxis protein [uncultured Albidiferax sp.]
MQKASWFMVDTGSSVVASGHKGTGKGRFSRRIGGVQVLVLAVAMLGSALGVWSLQRVSQETAQMVNEALVSERVAGDLLRQVSINIARSKGFALSSEPEVGEALLPEMQKTAAEVAALRGRLGPLLRTPPDLAALARIQRADADFAKALQELVQVRDFGVTANIQQVYATRYTPAAQSLLAEVTLLESAQRAKIAASVVDIGQVSRTAQWGLVLFGVGALVLGGWLSVWLVRGITGPIQRAVATANRVAALDLRETIAGHDRDEGGHLLAALGRMQLSLHTLVAHVQDSSHHVADGAREIASGNLDFSNRTEQAAASLQQTAAAVAHIVGSLQQSLAAASRGETLAQSAMDHATSGGVAITSLMQTMGDIHASSRKIEEITAVIDGIAFQTNILALNAAVEAARAGEYGRGFAVVAQEVRALANRSAVAAREIKVLIAASVGMVQLGSDKVHQARDTMGTIVGSVGQVAHAIGEIATASLAQNQGMSHISAAVNQMDQITQQNAAVVEQTAAAAQSLQAQANDLRDVAGQFRLPGLA